MFFVLVSTLLCLSSLFLVRDVTDNFIGTERLVLPIEDAHDEYIATLQYLKLITCKIRGRVVKVKIYEVDTKIAL